MVLAPVDQRRQVADPPHEAIDAVDDDHVERSEPGRDCPPAGSHRDSAGPIERRRGETRRHRQILGYVDDVPTFQLAEPLTPRTGAGEVDSSVSLAEPDDDVSKARSFVD